MQNKKTCRKIILCHSCSQIIWIFYICCNWSGWIIFLYNMFKEVGPWLIGFKGTNSFSLFAQKRFCNGTNVTFYKHHIANLLFLVRNFKQYGRLLFRRAIFSGVKTCVKFLRNRSYSSGFPGLFVFSHLV